MVGIDGAFIKYSTSGFELRNDVRIPKPTFALVEKLCQLGHVYRQIVSKLESGSFTGLIAQALVGAVKEELKEYLRLVCLLESSIESHRNNGGQFCSTSLSLKRVFVWTRGPLFKLFNH